jgi:hypothetical protein
MFIVSSQQRHIDESDLMRSYITTSDLDLKAVLPKRRNLGEQVIHIP